MNIQFLGAAKTVTGSCYLIEACGVVFTVDCGMHQGGSAAELRNLNTQYYQAKKLKFILLTHAHIDHSGLLPRIVNDGFTGPIYCTEPTKDLVEIMLEDSAYIQEVEAMWKYKKLARHNGQYKNVDPLYTVNEAKNVKQYVHDVKYNVSFEPYPGIQVTYRNAGHILGAAFLELVITEDNKSIRLVFSGDLGRFGSILMPDPVEAQTADYLFLESTYGDRNHKDEFTTLSELSDAIMYSYRNKEKIIIPSFAVGRTQEILCCLYMLWEQGKLPSEIPIFVDSPLAIRATEIFRKYIKYLKIKEVGLPENVLDALPNLKYTLSTEESQAINSIKGPAIVISASGMCNAGRIKHHLRHNAWRQGSSLVFVGYQAIGTPGRRIVDGAKSIRIFNEEISINARVYTLGGFSAHAGQNQLLDWLDKMRYPGMQVILVHGEESSEKTLAQCITDKYSLPVYIPEYLETLQLVAKDTNNTCIISRHEQKSKIDWNILFKETDTKYKQLFLKLKNIEDKSWEEQIDIRSRLLELNKEILSFLTEL